MTGMSRVTVYPHRGANLAAVALIMISMIGAALFTGTRSASAASAVTTSAVNLRAGNRLTAKIRLVVPGGATVDVISGNRRGFYKAVYSGVTGYIYADFLDFSGGGGGGGGGNGSGPTGSAQTTSSVNLRSGPSTADGIILVVPRGATVSLTGSTSNGFSSVSYQGSNGWIYTQFLGTVGAGDGGGGDGSQDPGSGNAGSATTTSSLNLRVGPSTTARVILVMPSGAGVTLTGNTSGGFSGVVYNGTSGWASSTYLSTSGGGGGGGGDGNGSYDTNGDGVWQRDEIVAIIYAAAAYYGQDGNAMLRVATCESGLSPTAYNGIYGASGLFQFLPGTFASTPYASESIWDPVANAFAAGWMWSVGRRGEWVCQ